MNNVATNNGAYINGRHTYRDYGLIIGNTDTVGAPEPYLQYVDVPYGKKIDFSSVLGAVKYTGRILKMEVGAINPKSEWPAVLTKLYEDLQGALVSVVFDNDNQYHYTGRAQISDFKRERELGTLTITVDADPFKYGVAGTTEGWNWDSFCFNTDVVREYGEILVAGSREVCVFGFNRPVVPKFICSDDMTLTIAGKTYILREGETQNSDIQIIAGENLLAFEGSGTISIDYREKCL